MATASLSPINGTVNYEGKPAQTYTITGSVSYTSYTNRDNSITYTVSTVKCNYSGSSWSGGVEKICRSCCGTWGLRWWNGSNFKTWQYGVGKHFPTGSSSHTTNRGLTFTLEPGESATYQMYALFSPGCGTTTRSLVFKNNNSKPTPRPPSIYPTCSANPSTGSALSMSASFSYGYCDSQRNSSSYAIYSDEGLSQVVTSGSGGGGMITGLAPNTRYWAEFSASNGCYTRTASCNAVTVTPNALSEAAAISFDRGQVRLAVTNGGGVYAPTTKVYIQPCGGGTAREVATSTTKAVEVVSFEGLEPETCYNLWAVTTTDAGAYTGNTVQITTPRKGICVADFTSIDPKLDVPNLEAYADVCYKWETTKTPATIVVRYRVKDGFDTQWYESEELTVEELTGEYCLTLHNLYPNQTVYEAYIHTATDEAEYDSPLREFVTPVLPKVEMHNCENFFYLTELLCASINKIKHGDKTIYANPYSQAVCDPYNDDPTYATLWSRALRLFHAMYCVVANLGSLAASKEGQYYVGEVGWQDIQTIIDETDEDNQWKIATSNAIYKYLNETIKEVWHYQGTVDVLVQNVADLADYPTARTAIVASEKKLYNKVDDEWAVATEQPTFENHGVWHINLESNTELGHVVADSGWYYWEGVFKPLDQDLRDVTALLTKLEEQSKGAILVPNGRNSMRIMVADKDEFACGEVNPNKDVVTLITEPTNIPAKPIYTLSFDMVEEGAPQVEPQRIVSGGLATSVYPENWEGHSFSAWLDTEGNPFDWQKPILEDTVAVVKWYIEDRYVYFNLNGGTGTTPSRIGTKYGQTVELPTDEGFSREGYGFNGWADEHGEVYTNATPIRQNVVLYAIWERDLINVYFDPTNGGEIITTQVPYGEGATAPENPSRQGYIFNGWFTRAEGGEPFNPETRVTASVTYYAQWVPNLVTITFDANGGTPVEPMVVAYGTVVTPPITTRDGYVFEAWLYGDTEYDFSIPVTHDMTLLATWSEAFVVEFDLNGGTGDIPDQMVKTGGYATEPTAPTKEDCDFGGWKEIDAAKVTFNAQNGTTPFVVLVEKGKTVAEPAEPIKEGCTFNGWYQGTPGSDDPTPLGYHKVTLNQNNGEPDWIVYVKDGETLPPIMNPKADKCRFEGWTSLPTEVVQYDGYSQVRIKE